MKDDHDRQALLLKLSDAVRPLSVPALVQAEACRVLGEHLGVDRAYYVEIDEAAGLARVDRDYVRSGASSLVGAHRIADFAWSVDILRRGDCHVVDNVQTSPHVPPADRAACHALQITACLGAPVIKDGRLLGALCVTDQRPRAWSDHQVSLLREVSERLWSSIQRARAEEGLRRRSVQLEWQARQLRRLASELTLAEHKTRELISKMLHDHLQQLIVGARMKLEAAAAQLHDDAALEGLRKDLSEAAEVARSLSVDVFPPVLRSEGLPDALHWLANWAHRKFGVTVVIDADAGADPKQLETRILLFESVRELIFNAIKHGQVQRVTVDLSRSPDGQVEIVVADEGPGFHVEQVMNHPSAASGLGLFSIRQRVAWMGGSMEIDSAPGAGASFTLTVP